MQANLVDGYSSDAGSRHSNLRTQIPA